MNVEKEGLYSLNFRYQQSMRLIFREPAPVSGRRVPFTEANALRFPFNLDWEFRPLSTPAGEAVAYLRRASIRFAWRWCWDYEESIRNIGAVVSH